VSFHDPLSDLAISSSGFVFDPHSGATFTLNVTGLTIVAALKEGATFEQLLSRVRETYAEVPAELVADVAAFLGELRENGLTDAEHIGRGAK
jgi:PqqD family protein of HPr-rel-A system